MKCSCINPECKCDDKRIKRSNGELQRKWLQGSYSDHNAIALIELLVVQCHGRQGCGAEFIIQRDYPLNPVLAVKESLHQDYGLYKSALKNKPGTPIGGTTVSEFTQKIAQGVVPVSYLEKRMAG